MTATDKFQIAAERAAANYPAGTWLKLSATEQSAATYRKLGELDTPTRSLR